MPAAVVAHRGASRIVYWQFVEVAHQLVDWRLEKFGVFHEGVVEILDIGGMVLVVMDFHGSRINMGFESVEGVWQFRQRESRRADAPKRYRASISRRREASLHHAPCGAFWYIC